MAVRSAVLIGVVGSSLEGKTTFARYLVSKYGFRLRRRVPQKKPAGRIVIDGVKYGTRGAMAFAQRIAALGGIVVRVQRCAPGLGVVVPNPWSARGPWEMQRATDVLAGLFVGGGRS